MIEEGSDLATQFLNEFIGGVSRLAVDEADEDGALREGEVFEFFGVSIGDFLFGLFHQLATFGVAAGVGEDGVVFLKLVAGQSGVGVHFAYVADEFAAFVGLGDLVVTVHEVDVHFRKLHDEDGVVALDAGVHHVAFRLLYGSGCCFVLGAFTGMGDDLAEGGR